MKPQKLQKANRKPTDVERAIKIKTALFKKGLKQQRIADDLGITHSAVSQFIMGYAANARISEWCKKNLGIEV